MWAEVDPCEDRDDPESYEGVYDAPYDESEAEA